MNLPRPQRRRSRRLQACCIAGVLLLPALASAQADADAQARLRQQQQNQELPRATPESLAAQRAQTLAGLRILAAHGAPKARLRLVEWHLQQQEHIPALTHLAEALRAGDLDARDLLLRMLGQRCWRMGIHQAENFIYEYQAAAAHDDPFGLTMMGLFWDRGFSPLEANTAQAVRLYERAVEAGSTWAMVLLGNLYEQGRLPAVPASAQKAAALYARAGLEEPLAAARLAALYRSQVAWPGRAVPSAAELRGLDAAAARHPESAEAPGCPAGVAEQR
jgi:TPR repeat protein